MAPTIKKGIQKPSSEESTKANVAELQKRARQQSKFHYPPPATRHRGVLALTPSVPLFDFGNRTGEPTLQALINESKNAKPLLNVESVCTGDQHTDLLVNDLVKINVQFYGRKETNNCASMATITTTMMPNQSTMMKEIKAVMPKVWTPRMYLGAVNISSIEQNRSILVEAIYIR